jgi:hypothetical protein
VRPWKRQLSDDERSVLLSELVLRHPELAVDAEEITSTLLVVENEQELADEITAKLRALRPSGPVSIDTARVQALDVLQPYIDDLTWRKERGARRAAADITTAGLLGLYECRDDSDENMLLVRMGLPGAADDLARTVYEKVKRRRRGEFGEGAASRSWGNPGLLEPLGPLVSSRVRECEHHWPVAYHRDGQLGPGGHRPGQARLHRVR